MARPRRLDDERFASDLVRAQRDKLYPLSDALIEQVIQQMARALREYVSAVAARATESNDWPTAIPKDLHQSAQAGLAVYKGRPPDDVLPKLMTDVREADVEVSLDRARLVELYEDPLAERTRTARRNLDATSAAVMFGAYFARGKITLFGLDVQISYRVGIALALLVIYLVITFYFYQDSDRRTFDLKRASISDYARDIRAQVDSIDQRAMLAAGVPGIEREILDIATGWRKRQMLRSI